MAIDQAHDPLFDGRPDGAGRAEEAALIRARPEDLKVHGLAPAGVDDRDRSGLESPLARGRGDASLTTQIARHLLERPLGCGKTDTQEGRLGDRLETLQEQGKEDPALVAADGVNLIDDHVGNAAQDLAGPAGEHEVKRFGRRDQDIGRLADQPGAIASRSIAAADGHLKRAQGRSAFPGSLQDARQRHLEVTPYVLIESLQRRNIEDPHAGFAPGGPPEQVERRQERRQGLARSGGRHDQRVPPGRDGRPAQPLRRCRVP